MTRDTEYYVVINRRTGNLYANETMTFFKSSLRKRATDRLKRGLSVNHTEAICNRIMFNCSERVGLQQTALFS